MSSLNFLPAKNHDYSSESLESKSSSKEQSKTLPEGAATSAKTVEVDPLSHNYGDMLVEDLQSKAVSGRKWTEVGSLDAEFADRTVLIRGFLQRVRVVGKKMAFLVVRRFCATVQCVLRVSENLVSMQMIKFVNSLSRESIVEVEGVVKVPFDPIKGTTQEVEIIVRKLYCINRAIPNLPLNVEDAARSEEEIREAEKAGEKLVRVNLDTRLNNRVLELRTPANQAIFPLKFFVYHIYKKFLVSEGFFGIHTPKINAGASEGGASVFKLDYKGQPACLAQSPQLHKQMIICSGYGRVFEVGSVYRAEDSFTHRHLCEFVGLDVEMEIKEHYFEVLDIVDRLFVTMFDYLNENCKKLLDAINRQFPFKPLKYLQKTLQLTFEEGIKMLKDAGVEVDPFGDLNTEAERTLGRLVLEKYGTEFYILHRYPLAVRPFYTMPCYDNPLYSNSFDVFIRGEEIISGAQRIHMHDLLTTRAEACGIDVSTISKYLDSFGYGVSPHAGFGVGLERVVMLFCGLSNIRQTSLFPRDPHRLAP